MAKKTPKKSVFSKLEKKLEQPIVEREFVRMADKLAFYKSKTDKPARSDVAKPTSRIWIILADLHYPEQDRVAVDTVFDYLEQNRKDIHGVILLGDNLDCQSISRHTEGLPGLRREGGFNEDIVGFDAQIMAPIEKMLPDARKVWFEGNHEAWLTQWLEKEPQFKGALSFPRLLRLEERGWKFIPQGEAFFVGVCCLRHGDAIGSGVSVAKKLVETQCCVSVMGHCHTYSAYTKTSEVKKADKWIGYTLPCLTNTNPKYGKGRPNSHIHGFGIIEEWSNGFVNVYAPIITNGRFSFGGKLYGR